MEYTDSLIYLPSKPESEETIPESKETICRQWKSRAACSEDSLKEGKVCQGSLTEMKDLQSSYFYFSYKLLLRRIMNTTLPLL